MDIYSVKTYNNATQFLTDLDTRIQELEELVKTTSKEIESLRPLLERYRRLRDLLKKFSGGQAERSPAIEITGLQLYIDPNPIERVEILEESYKHMVDMLSVLKKVREVARSVIEQGGLEQLKVAVQYKNGIPTKLIISD
ncbi:MAG: hypothetical protein ACK4M3_04010 [Pyrobaculum sp.]